MDLMVRKIALRGHDMEVLFYIQIGTHLGAGEAVRGRRVFHSKHKEQHMPQL